MSALTNQVNDMEYIFTENNTIYAVPIECIALERGGTDPFGKWYQASNSYWSYVLVQYDGVNSSTHMVLPLKIVWDMDYIQQLVIS